MQAFDVMAFIRLSGRGIGIAARVARAWFDMGRAMQLIRVPPAALRAVVVLAHPLMIGGNVEGALH